VRMVKARRRAEWRKLKKRVTLFLDADVLAWFREQGPGYQTEIDRALWEVVREEKRRRGK